MFNGNRLKNKSLMALASFFTATKKRTLYFVTWEEKDDVGNYVEAYKDLMVIKNINPTDEELELLWLEQSNWNNHQTGHLVDLNGWTFVDGPLFSEIFSLKMKRFHKAMIIAFLKVRDCLKNFSF